MLLILPLFALLPLHAHMFNEISDNIGKVGTCMSIESEELKKTLTSALDFQDFQLFVLLIKWYDYKSIQWST
jgi:hypothetical protein